MAGFSFTGQSRSGKTTGLIPYVLRDAGRRAKVIIDPQWSLAFLAILHLVMNGCERWLRVIRFADLDRGFGFLQMRRSRHPNPVIRRQEDKQQVMGIGRILLNRSELDPSLNRLIWEWLIWGLKLVLYAERPLYWLPYAYRPRSKHYLEMIRRCDDEATKEKMLEPFAFSRKQLRDECGPALRIAEVCEDPAFVNSCGNIDFAEQLLQNRILVFSGDGLDREACRTLLIAVISKTLQFGEQHNHPSDCFIDEWANWNLLTPEFGDGIASLQKKNLDFYLASQTLGLE